MDNCTLVIGLLIASVLILDTIVLYIRYPSTDKKKKGLYDIGKSMTIGGREVQEDQIGDMTTAAGVMAVLADGAGKEIGRAHV